MLRRIHVVAAVLEDPDGRVLVTQRPPGKTLAGAWEFPGGKLMPGEDRLAGLARELDEELGLQLRSARPLIRYRHRYPELEVDLDAWRVSEWQGMPQGLEGQAFGWHAPEDLPGMGLLPADAAVVRAIRLADCCIVTPPSAPAGEEAFLDALEQAASACRSGFSRDNGGSGFSRDIVAGSRMRPLLLRRPDLDPQSLLELAAGAACRVEGTGVRLLLHGDPSMLAPMLIEPPEALRARLGDALAGLHVPARFLRALHSRPVPETFWFGVSCHDAEQLDAALAAGADYAFLGPVMPTSSHPGQPGIGWQAFAAQVEGIALPVYAIGGLAPGDLDAAWAAGAQGIAAIRSLWP